MLRTAFAILLNRCRSPENGVTQVEYAVMMVLIGIAVASFGLGLSGSVTSIFQRTMSILNAAS